MTIIKKERNRDPKVARKMQSRKVMNRAWEIAKNAHNSLISNPEKIVSVGASTSPSEFFSEAVKLAWAEVKTGETLYKMNGSLPRKVLPRINFAVNSFIKLNNLEFSKSVKDYNFELANVALVARYGSEKTSDDMLQSVKIASDKAFPESETADLKDSLEDISTLYINDYLVVKDEIVLEL